MDKQLAGRLMKIVNSSELNSTLVEYSRYRIEVLKERLTTANAESVSGLQAQIKELKRLETLRLEVIKAGE